MLFVSWHGNYKVHTPYIVINSSSLGFLYMDFQHFYRLRNPLLLCKLHVLLLKYEKIRNLRKMCEGPPNLFWPKFWLNLTDLLFFSDLIHCEVQGTYVQTKPSQQEYICYAEINAESYRVFCSERFFIKMNKYLQN